MRAFCFTVDDNIRFLKEINENNYESIFCHPYLAMYKRLHKLFGLKVQLNLFECMQGFDLTRMPDTYYQEFEENSDWLKLSFHSKMENFKPYEFSGYTEVCGDCKKVNDNIKRFASPSALAKTTTIHYCLATKEGLRALKDNGVVGLLGLFGDEKNPRISYGLLKQDAAEIRKGRTIKNGEINFAAIDIVLNNYSKESILSQLEELRDREIIKVMIHEQYFYEDYSAYQPEFEEKLTATFSFFKNNGYQSEFFEDLI